MASLDQLPEPWRESFRLAWAAYCAGSVPCGSVLTDESGVIVGRGRNRTQETDAPSGQIFGTGLAHAEINAIIGLPDGTYPDHVLYSSLEPCSLCVGAAVMCEIGTVSFAAHDLWSGATGVQMSHMPQAAKVAPTIDGPLAERFGIFGAALYLERLMRIKPDHDIVTRHRDLGYEAVEAAERLRTNKVLERGAGARAELDEIWPEVLPVL